MSESAAVLLLLAGLILIVIGIAMWAYPAAFIAAGLALCFLATLWSRGATDE